MRIISTKYFNLTFKGTRKITIIWIKDSKRKKIIKARAKMNKIKSKKKDYKTTMKHIHSNSVLTTDQ